MNDLVVKYTICLINEIKAKDYPHHLSATPQKKDENVAVLYNELFVSSILYYYYGINN